MHQHQVEAPLEHLHGLPVAPRLSPLLHDVAQRAGDKRRPFRCSRPFQQRFKLEAHLPAAEGKSFDEHDVGPQCLERRQQLVPPPRQIGFCRPAARQDRRAAKSPPAPPSPAAAPRSRVRLRENPPPAAHPARVSPAAPPAVSPRQPGSPAPDARSPADAAHTRAPRHSCPGTPPPARSRAGGNPAGAWQCLWVPACAGTSGQHSLRAFSMPTEANRAASRATLAR
jgi:hypothetical protein